MPRRFRRSGYKGRYRRRKSGARSWARAGASVGRWAYQAYKGVKYLKGLVNAELHKTDSTAASFPITTGGVVVQQLNQVAIGDSSSTRTGNSIFVRRFDMRGTVTINGAAVASVVRMILFVDNQQIDDTVPTVAQLLQTASVNSPLNANTVGRFTIWKDFKFTLSAVRNPIRPFRILHNCKHHIRFNGAAASDYQKGCVWIVMITDDANNPSCVFENRTSFYDN